MSRRPTVGYVTTIGCSQSPPGCQEDEIAISVPHGTVYPGRYGLFALVECDTCHGEKLYTADDVEAQVLRGEEPEGHPCPACWGGWIPKDNGITPEQRERLNWLVGKRTSLVD